MVRSVNFSFFGLFFFFGVCPIDAAIHVDRERIAEIVFTIQTTVQRNGMRRRYALGLGLTVAAGLMLL